METGHLCVIHLNVRFEREREVRGNHCRGLIWDFFNNVPLFVWENWNSFVDKNKVSRHYVVYFI